MLDVEQGERGVPGLQMPRMALMGCARADIAHRSGPWLQSPQDDLESDLEALEVLRGQLSLARLNSPVPLRTCFGRKGSAWPCRGAPRPEPLLGT